MKRNHTMFNHAIQYQEARAKVGECVKSDVHGVLFLELQGLVATILGGTFLLEPVYSRICYSAEALQDSVVREPIDTIAERLNIYILYLTWM